MSHRLPSCSTRGPLAFAALLLLSFLLLSPAAMAADGPVGRVIVANGDVTAVRAGESARSLDRGAPVYEGDEVRTGMRATAQLRFSDGGLFALEADTRFAVDTYGADDDEGGSALMRFLQGALRTITGSIGQGAGDTYRLNTPTATIGVRGTAYALSYCDDDCATAHDGPAGLYGRVGDGEVLVNTPRGVGAFGAGSYFFVPEGGAARSIIRPPTGILDGAADAAREEAGERLAAAAAGTGALPTRDDVAEWFRRFGITGVIFESGDTFDAEEESTTTPTTTTGLAGAAITASGVDNQAAPFFGSEFFPEGGNFTTDGSGNVDGVQFSSSGPNVQVTGATLVESGVESDLGVSWGRWEGLSPGELTADGNPATGNLAFAATDNFTEPTTVASLSGTLNYGNPTGPQPFDNLGKLWTVDALSLGVDFDAGDVIVNQFELSRGQIVTLSLDTVVSGSSPVTSDGIGFSVTGANGGAGVIGRFLGGAAEGLLVIFQANDTGVTGATINGTKILRKQ